ncbi:hypothetical protein KY285_032951 [Solanum tuberosum]|nr:hypothetical protein KY289_033060 [Solanum tuberosum]KAH0647703.1 hypothetical protein KY285_032951 [Solanum tuberosum]
MATFLSCWLCIFVLLTKEGGFIRLGVLRNAYHLACGRRVSLAIPVLSSINKCLNVISKCSRLDLVHTCFPIHYVFGWLTFYYKNNYPLIGGPVDPLITTFSGEGAARYFGKEESRKRIHVGGTIAWYATFVHRPHAQHYRDDGTVKEIGVLDKIKGPLNEKVQKGKCSTQTYQTSHKRQSQDESSSTRGDRCWKRVRPPPDMPKDIDLRVVDITDNNVSSSRTLTTIKEPSNVNMLETKPQDSAETVERLD